MTLRSYLEHATKCLEVQPYRKSGNYSSVGLKHVLQRNSMMHQRQLEIGINAHSPSLRLYFVRVLCLNVITRYST